MKKYIKIIVTSIALTLLFSMTVFGREANISIDTSDATEVQSVDIEENIENGKAKIGGSVRGEWLANVYLEISNPQNGNIGVLLITNCYDEVDRILMGLYVDQLQDDGTWSQVDSKTFELLPEDFEDGKLINAIIDIEITGHEPGVYRLRSLHMVEKGDDTEFHSLETESLEITDRFPLSEDEATPNEATSGESAE